MKNQEQSMYEKNLFNKRYQGQEKKAVRQHERDVTGAPQQDMAKNRQGESVQASINQTADQIRMQVQQATEMKLQNKGVYQKAEDMRKMVSGTNQNYIQGQAEVTKAYAAGEKNAKEYDAMQLNTNKNADTIQGVAKAVTDDVLFTAAQGLQKNNHGNKSSWSGMADSNQNSEKTLSKSGHASKPQMTGQQKEKTLHAAETKESNVIHHGTSSINEPTDNSGIMEPLEHSDETKHDESADIKLYFIPDFDAKGHKMQMASKGRIAQAMAVKFRPVVYLPESEASDYAEVASSQYQVTEGMKQIDAFDYAKKNQCTIADIMKKDANYVEMMNHSDITNSDCPLKPIVYKMNAGNNISPYATMKGNYDGYAAIAYNEKTGNAYNGDAFYAAAYAVNQNAPNMNDMMSKSTQYSINHDREQYPDVYDEIDTANEYIMAKRGVIADKNLSKKLRYSTLAMMENEYIENQEARYIRNGFSENDMDALKRTGQIGVDAIAIKSLLKTYITPDNLNSEQNHPVPNSGLFTVVSDSYKKTNFGQYLKQHENEINGYIGDAFGYPEDVKDMPKAYIIDSDKNQNGLTPCAIVYSGCEGLSTHGKTFDEVVRNAVSETLKNYGDNRARISENTYAATPYELNYASSYQSQQTIRVSSFKQNATPESPNTSSELNTSLLSEQNPQKDNQMSM